MLRRVAEILSRGVVLKRRLPTQFGSGPLFVSPDSGLKYYRLDLKTADPTLFRMAAELVRPGDIVWDIGANVGLFTFAAAGLASPRGHVIAVEPDTWLVSLLPIGQAGGKRTCSCDRNPSCCVRSNRAG
jgi:hypothetical protein